MQTPMAMILEIVKGVAKTPGDVNTAEQGLDSINLLDEKGFSCDSYDMRIPALKAGAVWADTPLSDGRQLVSGAFGNVQEDMRIEVRAGTLAQLAALLSKLGRFQRDCNDFWDTQNQIEPVYLKHRLFGEPGPRYALLYSFDFHIEAPTNPNDPFRTITLKLEREIGWRGIAPGDNPKKWTTEVFLHQQYNNNTAALFSGNHLVEQVIQNRMESNTTDTALLSRPYFDIPATSIPGDLPALVQMDVQCETVPTNGLNRFYVGKSSKPDLAITPSLTDQPYYYLVAADGGSNVDASDANDTGGPIEASSGTNRRKQITFATASLQDRITWSGTLAGTSFHPTSLRGRFMVFIRARLSAASTVMLNLRTFVDSAAVTYPSYALTGTGSGGTGNTTVWQVIYMGIVTFPITEQRIMVDTDGLGIQVGSSAGDLVLQAERTGAACTLYVADLIFIPIDEGAWMRQAAVSIAVGNNFLFDNTGYFLHGRPGMYTGDTFSVASAEDRGSDFYLTPGVRNRIIMFADLSPNLAGTEAESGIDASFRVRLNIVPRWSGLRDI